MSRHYARSLALEALYAYEMHKGDLPLEEIWEFPWKKEIPPKVKKFARELIQGAISHKKEIDHLIQRYSKNWDISRISPVCRSILSIALYELLFAPPEDPTPSAVVINEAIELAKEYAEEDAYRFIHALLDKILHEEKEYQGA